MSGTDIVLVVVFSLIVACGLIIALFFLLGYLTYREFVHRKKNVADLKKSPIVGALGPNFNEFDEFSQEAVENFKDVPYEWVSVIADDGVKLSARLYSTEGAESTVICLPGYNATALSGFAPIAPYYIQNGYNLLLVTGRGQGESGGRDIGFGTLEARDLIKWIDLTESKFKDTKIVIHGYSTGAVSALIAAGSELPRSVKCVISDSAYSKLWDVFEYQIKQLFKLAPFPILHIAEFFSKKKAGCDFRTSVIKYVETASVPILFIHGAKDMFVPTYMCEALYEACTAPKGLLIVEGAGHSQAYMRDSSAYQSTVREFIHNVA